jgi:hypothetical protein
MALSVGATDASGTSLYGEHVVAIAVDNLSICTVGANYQGQLGIGSTTASFSFQCGIGDLSAVEVVASSLINVSPNPASGEIHVEVESAHSTCVIRDLSGRIVGEYSLQTGTNTLDIHSFLPGTYLFDINGSVKKIMIQ